MPNLENNLYNFTLDKFTTSLEEIGLKKYRALQIWDWIYQKRIDSLDNMVNISKTDLDVLKSHYSYDFLKVEERLISPDETQKFLIRLSDGNIIETVLMKNNYGYSICISTQVGCNMGCIFCYSGLNKKVRSLQTWEMVGQILAVEKETKLKINNVVIMGIGEPFDNFDSTMDFIKIINHCKALDIGARHITVSTCGIIDKIYQFSELNLQVNLAISLHSIIQSKREKLMPIAKAVSIGSLNKAIFDYINKTNRKVTLEYIMIKDVNDTIEDCKELVNAYQGRLVYINLIPLNGNTTSNLAPSTPKRITEFFDYLMSHKIQTIIRRTQGNDINAACGQLRNKAIGDSK
jgi:23S rRNA (adenine2503-C2)-methyltransferase